MLINNIVNYIINRYHHKFDQNFLILDIIVINFNYLCKDKDVGTNPTFNVVAYALGNKGLFFSEFNIFKTYV